MGLQNSLRQINTKRKRGREWTPELRAPSPYLTAVCYCGPFAGNRLSFGAQCREQVRGRGRDLRRNYSKLAGSGQRINPVCHIKDCKESISEWHWWFRVLSSGRSMANGSGRAQEGIQAWRMLEERNTRPSITAGSEKLCLPGNRSLPFALALTLSLWLQCPRRSVVESCAWLAFPDVRNWMLRESTVVHACLCAGHKGVTGVTPANANHLPSTITASFLRDNCLPPAAPQRGVS